ncbi:MAG TPA: DUF2922 domain-containing protein [Firmicutes bacterium]|uniref:DUF2922 domain-containing protein n=1 Tax=Gelria sp. Kuro-4 TaxID=2796927 RepID=UPI0019B2ABF0|nr:DUF2922 domain-containing protein [Gelria sp. Kuro-4]MDI3522587.1 hypothetical protein [Bacillota bacterium]MDK2927770.1 hypothetical protein [Bacillota bacterium]BCV25541.1 hypothetical protein kuro4_23140 [Gelria sp. Kuro-4]HHV56236.1 DUF2922 domain-containing protein [Bacillota bacterium]
MEKTLSLVFKNAAGRTTTLSLAAPRDDLTDAEVAQVMQTIIQKNIFAGSGGELVAAATARLVSRDVSEFTVA